MAMTSELSRLERQIRRAGSYTEWRDLAEQHDEESGRAKWRAEPESSLFDFKNIEHRLHELREFRLNQDDMGLLFNLNEGIHGNQGGMGN